MAAPILRHHTPHHDFAKANVAETTRQPSVGSREMQTPRGIDDSLQGPLDIAGARGRPANVADGAACPARGRRLVFAKPKAQEARRSAVFISGMSPSAPVVPRVADPTLIECVGVVLSSNALPPQPRHRLGDDFPRREHCHWHQASLAVED